VSLSKLWSYITPYKDPGLGEETSKSIEDLERYQEEERFEAFDKSKIDFEEITLEMFDRSMFYIRQNPSLVAKIGDPIRTDVHLSRKQYLKDDTIIIYNFPIYGSKTFAFVYVRFQDNFRFKWNAMEFFVDFPDGERFDMSYTNMCLDLSKMGYPFIVPAKLTTNPDLEDWDYDPFNEYEDANIYKGEYYHKDLLNLDLRDNNTLEMLTYDEMFFYELNAPEQFSDKILNSLSSDEGLTPEVEEILEDPTMDEIMNDLEAYLLFGPRPPLTPEEERYFDEDLD